MADWETEVGLSRALWLWLESAAWRKRRTAKRWMEFLQKLQGKQLAAQSRHWIIWSAVAAKYTRVRMQVGIAEMRREAKR